MSILSQRIPPDIETAVSRRPDLGDWMIWVCGGKALNSKTGRRQGCAFLRVFIVQNHRRTYTVKSDIGLHHAQPQHLYWPASVRTWLEDKFRAAA